jgi:hypothetical protein
MKSMIVQETDHVSHEEEARNEYGIIVKIITRRKLLRSLRERVRK